MKVYEGSVGDRVAQLKGNKLQLFDVLRLYVQELGYSLVDQICP